MLAFQVFSIFQVQYIFLIKIILIISSIHSTFYSLLDWAKVKKLSIVILFNVEDRKLNYANILPHLINY